MLKKRTIVFFLLLFFTQFWTVKIGPFSVAMLSFILASLIVNKFLEINIIAYLALGYFIVSTIFLWPNQYDNSLHYSILLPFISIILQLLFLNYVAVFNRANLPEQTHVYVYFCLLFSLIAAAALTPENVFSPGDGPVAFFNEKGIYGHYLTLLAIILVVHRWSKINILLFLLIGSYVLLIIQAGRSLLLLLAFLFLIIQIGGGKVKIYSVAAFFSTFLMIASSDFGNILMVKLAILASGDGVVGRYAAMSLLLNSSIQDIMFGHGYGTYLNYRAFYIDLPAGAEYDYPGSLILQFIFEIGLLPALVILSLLVKIIYRRVTILYLCSLLCLVAIGGTHDIQMLTTIIFFVLMHQALIAKSKWGLS